MRIYCHFCSLTLFHLLIDTSVFSLQLVDRIDGSPVVHWCMYADSASRWRVSVYDADVCVVQVTEWLVSERVFTASVECLCCQSLLAWSGCLSSSSSLWWSSSSVGAARRHLRRQRRQQWWSAACHQAPQHRQLYSPVSESAAAAASWRRRISSTSVSFISSTPSYVSDLLASSHIVSLGQHPHHRLLLHIISRRPAPQPLDRPTSRHRSYHTHPCPIPLYQPYHSHRSCTTISTSHSTPINCISSINNCHIYNITSDASF